MSARRFTIDTNILIYSVAPQEGDKHLRAKEVLARAADCNCFMTLQALSEFFVVATGKQRMPKTDAANYVSHCLTLFQSGQATATAVLMAIADATAGRASYWDALLIATAAEAGCTAILTEDLSDGTMLGPVRILNPFSPHGGLTEPVKQLLAI